MLILFSFFLSFIIRSLKEEIPYAFLCFLFSNVVLKENKQLKNKPK